MATLKDVAKEAGLSVGTVSRVLNNRGYISEETKEKVRHAMDVLNYQPNEMARSLSKQTSRIIGLIVPSIEHPYFSRLIRFIELYAYKADYKVLLFGSQGKQAKEDKYIQDCRSNRVAGLILCTGSIETTRLHNLGFPVVTYERFMNSGDACVECDNYQGGCLAAEELIRKGCRKPVCIRGTSDVSMPADYRMSGFMETCKKKGIAGRDWFFSPEMLDDMNYIPGIRECLDTYPDADGIFAGSDIIAAQAIQICTERGIQVPSQMKIVGYDDVPFSSMTTPPLTTIHQPIEEMAKLCVSIIANANEGSRVPERTTFPVTLIERGTT